MELVSEVLKDVLGLSLAPELEDGVLVDASDESQSHASANSLLTHVRSRPSLSLRLSPQCQRDALRSRATARTLSTLALHSRRLAPSPLCRLHMHRRHPRHRNRRTVPCLTPPTQLDALTSRVQTSMRLLSSDKQEFSMPKELANKCATLVNLAFHSTDSDTIPIRVPLSSFELRCALTTLLRSHNGEGHYFANFTQITDMIVLISWFDCSSAQGHLTRLAACFLSHALAMGDTRETRKALGLAPEPSLKGRRKGGAVSPVDGNNLTIAPASDAEIEDVLFSVASHLPVPDLVALKALPEWLETARAVLVSPSIPYDWGDWPTGAVDTFGHVTPLGDTSFYEHCRSATAFEASALLKVVASIFVAKIATWPEPGDDFILRRSHQVRLMSDFVDVLTASVPEAITPDIITGLSHLAALPVDPEWETEWWAQRHAFPCDILKAPIYDSAINTFFKERHFYLARCSEKALRPFLPSIFDAFVAETDQSSRANLAAATIIHPPTFVRILAASESIYSTPTSPGQKEPLGPVLLRGIFTLDSDEIAAAGALILRILALLASYSCIIHQIPTLASLSQRSYHTRSVISNIHRVDVDAFLEIGVTGEERFVRRYDKIIKPLLLERMSLE